MIIKLLHLTSAGKHKHQMLGAERGCREVAWCSTLARILMSLSGPLGLISLRAINMSLYHQGGSDHMTPSLSINHHHKFHNSGWKIQYWKSNLDHC